MTAALAGRRLLVALALLLAAVCLLLAGGGQDLVTPATAEPKSAHAKPAGKCKGGKGKRASASKSPSRAAGKGRGKGKGCRGKGGQGAGNDRGGDGAGGAAPPPGDSTGGSGGSPPIVAGPGASSAGYATTAPTVSAGGSLSFANLDVVEHDVRSVERAGDGSPLSSPMADPGETVPIAGLDRVSAGASYEFFCAVHPGMRGTLSVPLGAARTRTESPVHAAPSLSAWPPH